MLRSKLNSNYTLSKQINTILLDKKAAKQFEMKIITKLWEEACVSQSVGIK